MRFKHYVWVLVMVLSALPAAASISYNEDFAKIYNLGDKISLQLSISNEQYFDGLLKVSLECADRKLPFYITPLVINKGQEIEEKIPGLTASKHIVGDCSLVIHLISADGTITEEKIIDGITITNNLNLTLATVPQHLPAEYILFEGLLKDVNGNSVKNASVILNFNDGDYDIAVKNGAFRHTVKTPASIKSGKHAVTIIAEDIYGNKGEILAYAEITPKPTQIEISLNKQVYFPGENVLAGIKLIDQNKELINDSVKLIIKDSAGSEIFSDLVQSGSNIEQNLYQYAAPGVYQARAEKREVLAVKTFNVSSVEKLSITIDGNNLMIKNVGNVRYNDKADILVEQEEKDFILSRKLDIVPGEVLQIDLSKELPTGNYDLKVAPAAEGVRAEYSLENGTEINKLQSVPIEDKRSLYKKIVQGLSGITGGVIGVNEGIAAPFYIIVFLILLILGLIFVHKKYFMEYRLIDEFSPKKNEVSKMLDIDFEKKRK